MIRLKLGRRVAALFLSALLLSASVLPAFATSTSGQLQEVGWAETVSSFLMASGIYPFESDSETGYEEWSVSSLKVLWDEFRDDVTQVTYDIVDLTGNLVKGVNAIASGRWSVLREFATWIVNKYNVTDNQTGVELGAFLGKFTSVPLSNATPPSVSWVRQNGAHFDVNDSRRACVTVRLSYGFYVSGYFYLVSRFSASSNTVYITDSGSNSLFSNSGFYESYSSVAPGVYVFAERFDFANGVSATSYNSLYPVFSSVREACEAFYNYGSDGRFSGITADTTTVSIPAPLPSGTDFGGLAVSGTGVAATPEQLEEIVQNAVKEALKPSVAVVPVALSPDVNVSPSGEITLSGDVAIDPGNIPLQPSDYSAPNLSKVFPFSIPWDVLAVLDVLDAEPVRPEFNVDLYIPVLDVHVPWTIGVSEELQEPVDNFMASMRGLLLVAMCVGTLWLFWRSNL